MDVFIGYQLLTSGKKHHEEKMVVLILGEIHGTQIISMQKTKNEKVVKLENMKKTKALMGLWMQWAMLWNGHQQQ